MITKWIFVGILVGLVLIAASPTVMAWGKKAKEYFKDSFKD